MPLARNELKLNPHVISNRTRSTGYYGLRQEPIRSVLASFALTGGQDGVDE